VVVSATQKPRKAPVKPINTIFLLIGFLAAVASAAAPPDQLTLADLVNHPDRWPPTVSAQRDFQFTNGAVVHQGDKLTVFAFDGTSVLVIAPGNLRFKAVPADVGFLDAANQAWSALTPAQRAVDPDSLPADPSLWPVQIKTTIPLNCTFGNLPAGTQVSLFQVTAKGPDIVWPNSPNRLQLDFTSSDLITDARQLALLDPDKRPSRIAAALQPLLVDSDGQPYHDDHLADKKYFAFYFGAGWCPPCQAFSPNLVAYLNDALPKHPELAAVLMSNDHSTPDMLAYMKQEKMPFPAVPPDALNNSPILSSYAGKIIPDMVIVDRFGKILAANEDKDGNRGDPADTLTDLTKILAAQPPAQQ
jgi:thiol-disulfide isomerase/thioredoxin